MKLIAILRSWIVGFFRFWYHFIIGDDWTIAAAVAVGLLLTAMLNARGVPAWWTMPVVAILAISFSLRRTRRRA
jgi:hypothetical protein